MSNPTKPAVARKRPGALLHSLMTAVCLCHLGLPARDVIESARALPVIQEVDVVVVGGASSGVAAAVAAAQAGAKVFLAAPGHYLGEDICGSYRLWLEPGEIPTTALAQAVFLASSNASAPTRMVTPMQVKKTLDEALLQAKVPFLYECYATELLTDAQGSPAGVVLANRSGRQAVIAKVIIDATGRGTVVRMTPAAFTAHPGGEQTFARVVVGGAPRQGEGLSCQPRKEPLTVVGTNGAAHPVIEYQLRLPVKDGSFAALAAAEQRARDLTWTKESVDASEALFQVPPDSFQSKSPHPGKWPGAEAISLDVFRPAAVERIYALGGCAGLSREAAAEYLRPVNTMAVGSRVGRAAAALAATLPKPEGVNVRPVKAASPVPGEVREVAPDVSPRLAGARTVPAGERALPVLGEYDVVVVGGGTGGAPAGISAGRQGARTLLIEYLHGLGGVGTLGYISLYYHGNRVGFTTEVDQGIAAFGDKETRKSKAWNPDWKNEWYRQEARKAGTDIWHGTLGVGAVVRSNRVQGVVVATPLGRGVVLAKVVIDATGNAGIAAAAGAACRYTEDSDPAVQGAGLPPRDLGQRYVNTDFTFVDETDVFDIWRVLVSARQKYPAAYDMGQLLDTRERRQIVGDLTLSPMDMMLGRTHPDTVVIAKSNFDTHGFTVHPMFLIRPPDRQSITVRVPYRCLLPRGLDGILVTGLGVSAHRDAIPVIRMQPDVQNQGYAAGVAAAMIARKNGATRDLDLKALQRHLVEKGNLPADVLTETDSFPPSREQVVAAVSRVTNNCDGLEILMAVPDTALPLLRQALAAAKAEKDQVLYAQILAMLGDGSGAPALARAVAQSPWDQGWRYTGMGQFGPSLSRLDSWIIALGRCGDKTALQPILEKVGQLDARSEFSHFRAVAMALESLGDRAAAEPLAALLQKPGIRGHAVTDIQAALQNNPASPTDVTTRNQALSELILARALYRCGDHQGLGEAILRQYARDLHGHYARHAQTVLRR